MSSQVVSNLLLKVLAFEEIYGYKDKKPTGESCVVAKLISGDLQDLQTFKQLGLDIDNLTSELVANNEALATFSLSCVAWTPTSEALRDEYSFTAKFVLPQKYRKLIGAGLLIRVDLTAGQA